MDSAVKVSARPLRRRSVFHVLTLTTVFAASLLGSGCEGETGDEDGGPNGPVVVDLEIAPLSITLDVGESEPMVARLIFSDGSREDRTSSVRWATSDSRVATVDDDGLARGILPGMVEVTAATGVLSATAMITVEGDGPSPPVTLFYPPTLTLVAATSIDSVAPTVTGGVPDQFVVVPSLPSGLQLDNTNGVISGTPQSTSPAIDYVVTASNVAGAAAATIRISVLCDHDAPPDPTLDEPDENGADANGDGIDGLRCGPIFVAPTGNDDDTGTIDAPVATLTRAFELAGDRSPKRDVYAASGTYPGQLALADGVDLFGGYDAEDQWRRDAADLVIISGPSPTVTGNNLNEDVRLDAIRIVSPDAVVEGGDSIALDLLQSTATVTITRSEIRAGRGAAGLAGTDGVDAAPVADDGDDGGNGCEDGAGICTTCDQPGRGAGGFGLIVGTIGGRGGFGAIGEDGSGGQQSGAGGDDGEDGAFGGPGGTQGLNGGRGGDGAVGAPGLDGADGAGGDPGERGLDGQTGTHGGGGGGGGGGAGGIDGICDSFGGGGGGGGAGAGNGTSGKGGRAGGDSIAVRLAAATLVLDAVRIRASNGGNGGDGGEGGLGGAGAPGGTGGTGFEDSGPGGNGGAGGRGGSGGHGGGGGGGSSLGVFTDDADAITQTDVTFEIGQGGTGGSSLGDPGASGEAEDVLVGG